MIKITRLMLNRKVNENRKNIGFNRECMQLKYNAETNTIHSTNVRSTRFKKFFIEILKTNLEDNNLAYNPENVSVVVINDSCKYFEYKVETKLDEEVVAHELKVEAEEDKRDEKEREKKEKERKRKKVLSQKKKELDDIFYHHWIKKIKVFKTLIPETENYFEGKGKQKKYKSYFTKQATLFLAEIKKLNIGGGK